MQKRLLHCAPNQETAVSLPVYTLLDWEELCSTLAFLIAVYCVLGCRLFNLLALRSHIGLAMYMFLIIWYVNGCGHPHSTGACLGVRRVLSRRLSLGGNWARSSMAQFRFCPLQLADSCHVERLSIVHTRPYIVHLRQKHSKPEEKSQYSFA